MSHEHDEAAAAVEAVALLELAMNESQAPVGELGGALARMARALSGCSSLVATQRGGTIDADVLAHIRNCHETFEREVALCIENLQFHDRMIQQLTHAKNCLAPHSRGLDPAVASRVTEAWMSRHAAEGSIELF